MTPGEQDVAALAARLRRLEDIEAIRHLKARYLNACDEKRPDEVRTCFVDGRVIIDADYRGVFESADAFVAMYRDAACHDFVFDKHQGGNAEIEIVDDTTGRALWCLDYRNINTRDNTLTLMSTFYHDSYRKVAGRWKIAASRCEFRTVFHAAFAAGSFDPLIAGRSLAGPTLATPATA